MDVKKMEAAVKNMEQLLPRDILANSQYEYIKGIHQSMHKNMHMMLDWLIADFLFHNPNKGLQNTTLLELINWSHQQTIEPQTKPE